MIVSFLTYNYSAKDDYKTTEEQIKEFVMLFVRPIFILGIAYVVYQFI